MPNTREKLIELLQDDDCPLLYVLGENIGTLADYLIANGVTLQKEQRFLLKENGDLVPLDQQAENIKDLVPVHPDLHKAVRKLNEQYKHSKNSPYVRKPVAHALFKVWKWADR